MTRRRIFDQLTVAELLTAGRTKVLVAIAEHDALVKPATPIDQHAGKNTNVRVHSASELSHAP